MEIIQEKNSDFELIDKILSGEKNKYEFLIRKYNQRMYRVAKGILWDEQLIEDVMQDAYIKGFQLLNKFEKRSEFSTWLTRILINECLMIKRKDKRVTKVNLEDKPESVIHYFTPERLIQNKELKMLLEGTIEALPEKYRLVFVMREVENMSVHDTSQALEITETNVKARLSRAKEMLRQNLISKAPMSELLEFNLIRCDRIVQNVMISIKKKTA